MKRLLSSMLALAARADTPASAKIYLDKAKAAAKEAGLPEPASLVASR